MLDNYRDLNDELLGTPAILRELVTNRGPDNLPDEAITLIAALRDRDRAVLARLRTMTTQRDPYLRALSSDVGEVSADPASLLAEFDTARGEVVSLLMNLTLRDWERTAIDETEGETTLADEVERHVDFDENQVAKIREAVGA
jgi:hypothetical protein